MDDEALDRVTDKVRRGLPLSADESAKLVKEVHRGKGRPEPKFPKGHEEMRAVFDLAHEAVLSFRASRGNDARLEEAIQKLRTASSMLDEE